MQSRIARLRFIFDYGRGDSLYCSMTEPLIAETAMGTLGRPNNPTGVTGTMRDTGNEGSVGAHSAIEQAADAARPIVDSMASARTVQ